MTLRPIPCGHGGQLEGDRGGAADAACGSAPATLVAQALIIGGFRVRRLDEVTTLRGPGFRKAAFRVDLDDGSVVKARCMWTEANAWRCHAIRARLTELVGLAPILRRDGRVLIEAWVEGGSPPWPSAATIRAAAELLARLHGVRHLGRRRLGAERSTRRWRDTAIDQLQRLVACGAIDEGARSTLQSALLQSDPGAATSGLIHGDFCRENLVVSGDGALHAIDNEALRIDLLDLDLGMLWYRWPMPDASFRDFIDSYQRAAGRTAGSLDFWRLIAIINGAWFRYCHCPADAAGVMDRVRRLARSLEAATRAPARCGARSAFDA